MFIIVVLCFIYEVNDMKQAYIITREELAEKGLNLDDYALNGDLVQPIINRGLDIAVSRCCYLNDSFLGEQSIEQALDEKPELVSSFKKLQFNVIWNLIFTAEDNPIDSYIDTIIVHELGWGKINGIQKGLYYRHN